MDKLSITLMKINKAIDAYKKEYGMKPIAILTGLKCFKSDSYTIKDIPIIYEADWDNEKFEVM